MTVQTPGRNRWGTLLPAAALAATACGSPAEQPPATVPPTSISASTPAGGETVTVEGVVASGVEPDCLVLRTAQDTYLLLGGDREALRPGQRVRVVGRSQPGTPTTCMQGTPLQVGTVTSVPPN